MKTKYSFLNLFLTITALCLFADPVFPQDADIPYRPQGYVSDFVGTISLQDQQGINNLAMELENKTTAQLAVVTVPSTSPDTIEYFAVKLFEKWKIGQKGKDNGVLLLVALKDKAVRIEAGYGLEGALPDALCNKIIQSIIIPNFKKGQYSEGIKEGAKAIVSFVAREYNTQIDGANVTSESLSQNEKDGSSPVNLVIFLIFFLLIISRPFFWHRGGSRPRYGGGYWSGSGGGFGGGGFGGGSGGFGGFGGGSSGGGGASGRW